MKRSWMFLLVVTLFSAHVFAQNSYDELIKKGQQKDAAEEFDKALDVYSKAIEIEPDNPLAYDKRAITYIKMNKFPKAIRDINDALEIDPEFAPGYNHRGLANYYSNKSILAIQDFDMAIEIDTEYARAYFNRGLVKLDFGDVEGAYADFKKAGDLDYDQAEDAIWKYCTDKLFVVPGNAGGEDENDSTD
jgi:tetratricopeptide (TPR) repeat protein